MRGFVKLMAALHLSALAFPCAAQSLPQGLFLIGQFEIGKATVEITAYRLTKRGKRRCQLTDASLTAISTANGLSFRTRRELVERALSQSKPTTSWANMRVEEVYRRKPTDSEAGRIRRSGSDPNIEFDVVDTVVVRFKHGVVDDLYVKRLVSY